ncbi:MFS general substrate transporter [Rhizodiscina lignyota]|uniref:MFS general substrate transporter n=1 Tax=Rhizodiscina lignyota TaxID=1504668 RepID=A0A9P4M116_9PEZI|nr:MFS general substrate transporter [Rhizodiscina lignyota]
MASTDSAEQSLSSDYKSADADKKATISPTTYISTNDLSHVDAEKHLSPTANDDDPLSPEEERVINGWRWALACIALYISVFLFALDNTIVADVQAPVVERFGQVEKVGWLGIGFPLGGCMACLTLGKLFGLFENKWLYIASIIMFEAASALCGGAPTMDALVVGRVWAGLGGVGMYLGTLNLISSYTRTAERPLYIAGTAPAWGLGCILGPVFGGAFADSSATWRWSFYLNLVLFGATAPVLLFILKPVRPQPNTPLLEKLKSVDWTGGALTLAAYALFVVPVTFGGAQWSWGSGGSIILFVLFGVCLIALVLQQGFSILTTPERRVFPVDLLKSRTQILLYISTACGACALFTGVYYIPLFFAFVHNTNGIHSAVHLLPFICVAITVAFFGGILLPTAGRYMPFYLVSGSFQLIAACLFFTQINTDTSSAKIYGFSALMGVGAGLTQQAAFSISPMLVPADRASDALNFISLAQTSGILLSLTISSAVFQNVGFRNLQNALRGLDLPAADIHAALAGAKSDLLTTLPPAFREKAIVAIVNALRDGYLLVVAGGSIAIVCALLMKRGRMTFAPPTAG